MADNYPITPPPELVEEWRKAAPPLGLNREKWIATQAARWGADQELWACYELLGINGCPSRWLDMLRATRRPKPPSLKEQALAVLDDASDRLDAAHENIIRRALEQLDD